MKKQSKKIISLLLAAIMLITLVDPVATHAAAKSPVTKISTEYLRTGEKSGSTVRLHFWGSYFYRTTVTLAKSSKKTKIRLKYDHKIRPSKSGTFKLTVGKKTVKVCTLRSYPYGMSDGRPDYGYTTEVYLESVEIKTGKKWKKIKLANDQVKRGVFAKMNTYTLKKIPKGTKIRFTFHACVGVPRTSSAIR